MKGTGDVADDFLEADLRGESVVDQAYGAASLMERSSDETVVSLVEGSPVAAVDKHDDRGVSPHCWKVVDGLEGVVSVWNIKLAGQLLDGLGAKRIVAVEVLLEIRMPRS